MRIARIVRRTAHSLIRSIIRVWAFFARRYAGVPQAAAAVGKPKRILLMNGAHVGDLVISTSILPVLRSAYPDAEFGFLTGSWSSMVVKGNPEIAFTHQIDHWRLNRTRMSFVKKLRHFWRTRRTALREIEQAKYDVSLSLHCWFPDFIYLAWQARIPNRLGFRHSWFAPFATMVADFPQADFIHQGARTAEILKPLQIDPVHLSKRRSILPPSTPEARQEVCDLLHVQNLGNAAYIVIHIGSGEIGRELSIEFWRETANALSTRRVLLFTGKGRREEQQIARVIQGIDNCISACDRLSWNGFVAAIRGSEMLYGVESMAGHVAAAVGTPCTVLYTGTAGVARWRPEGDTCTVFTQHVTCAPCGRPSGCKEMTCLREIKPESILPAEQVFLK